MIYGKKYVVENKRILIHRLSSTVIYMDKALLFLIKLAWNSRIRLPVLIAVGFVAFDIRMQLEINIQTRRIRGRPIPRRRIDDENENVAHSRNNSESMDFGLNF